MCADATAEDGQALNAEAWDLVYAGYYPTHSAALASLGVGSDKTATLAYANAVEKFPGMGIPKVLEAPPEPDMGAQRVMSRVDTDPRVRVRTDAANLAQLLEPTFDPFGDL